MHYFVNGVITPLYTPIRQAQNAYDSEVYEDLGSEYSVSQSPQRSELPLWIKPSPLTERPTVQLEWSSTRLRQDNQVERSHLDVFRTRNTLPSPQWSVVSDIDSPAPQPSSLTLQHGPGRWIERFNTNGLLLERKFISSKSKAEVFIPTFNTSPPCSGIAQSLNAHYESRGGDEDVQGMSDLASTAILCKHFVGVEAFGVEMKGIIDYIFNEVALARPCTRTLFFAIALFHHLWDNGTNLRVTLCLGSPELAEKASSGAGLVILADTFYWCLWAATVAHWDSAYTFDWLNRHGASRGHNRQIQVALLLDIENNIYHPYPEYDWRDHLIYLLRVCSYGGMNLDKMKQVITEELSKA